MSAGSLEPSAPVGRAEAATDAYQSGEIDLETFCNRFIRLAKDMPRGEPETDALKLTAARLDSIRFSICAAEQPAAVADALEDFRRMTQEG